jgi:hypothetical protein
MSQTAGEPPRLVMVKVRGDVAVVVEVERLDVLGGGVGDQEDAAGDVGLDALGGLEAR